MNVLDRTICLRRRGTNCDALALFFEDFAFPVLLVCCAAAFNLCGAPEIVDNAGLIATLAVDVCGNDACVEDEVCDEEEDVVDVDDEEDEEDEVDEEGGGWEDELEKGVFAR